MAAGQTTVADPIRPSGEDNALRAELTVNAVEQSASEFALVLPPTRLPPAAALTTGCTDPPWLTMSRPPRADR